MKLCILNNEFKKMSIIAIIQILKIRTSEIFTHHQFLQQTISEKINQGLLIIY